MSILTIPYEMQETILATVNELIGKLCQIASVDRTEIRGVGFAGNTTMQQLLCGRDVRGLSALPFEPARYESETLPARDLPLSIAPDGEAYLFPVIGGFVGGDIVELSPHYDNSGVSTAVACKVLRELLLIMS